MPYLNPLPLDVIAYGVIGVTALAYAVLGMLVCAFAKKEN